MAPRFHAEHIGSLIRPASILEANPHAPGSKTNRPAVDKAVRDILQTQIDNGITPLTNGEFPRRSFFAVFFDKLEGFESRLVPIPDGFRADVPVIRGAAASGKFPAAPCMVAAGRIKWTGSAFMEEWTQIRDALSNIAGGDKVKTEEYLRLVKLTIPSPIVYHIRLKRGTAYTPESGYKSDEEFFADLTTAYREELQALYNAGCRYVQVDDPDLTYFCDIDFLEGLQKDGVDSDQLLSMYLKANNDAMKDRPADMVVSTHLCRGNLLDDLWVAKGDYENVAQRLFQELKYDAFCLEYDTEKAGSFEPLRWLPKDKTIVLGVVSTKKSELEDLDVLEEKVRLAAEVIAKAQGTTLEEVLRNQIAVSPQCGFASAEYVKHVGSQERMWEKLRLVRDLAKRISS